MPRTRTTKPTPPLPHPHTAVETDEDAPKLTGSREQFHRYQPAALALAPADVRPARVDVGRVVRNAARGVAAVLARRAELADVPLISLAQIDGLASLGEALAFAASMVEKFVPVTGDTREVLAQARRLRVKLLAKADVLVVDGVVPAQTVRGIRQGNGPRDTASDLVALADLFQQNAAAARRSTVIETADLEAADSLGRRLLATLHVAGERAAPAPELVAAAAARDRLWTLFERTWEANVWRAGAYLFLREVEAHVPLLMSGARPRRASEPVAAPAPPAPHGVRVEAQRGVR